ncbi:MAG TPA: peptidylprolyl isomerase [Candidatus Thermoplasmatota archaeon]|nr:peptidylprolyl isomerase [Candidatus Thermoplasmatota archaeon]
MSVARGDTVAVRYTGRLDNNEVFDTNRDDDEPLTFRVGDGQVIPGFETAVLGLAKGATKRVRIPPEEAYGFKRQDLVQTFDRDALDADTGPLSVGLQVEVEDEDGNSFPADVVEFDDETVTLDLNHPLAGEALTFDITVVEVYRDGA